MKTIRIELNPDAVLCAALCALIICSGIVGAYAVYRTTERDMTALRSGYEIQTGKDYVQGVW
jgi:hypothetical protein